MSRMANNDQGPRLNPSSKRHRYARAPFVVVEGTAHGRSGYPAGAGRPIGVVDTARMTAAADGLEHEISGDELNAGRVLGRYRSLCGAIIAPAALTVPAGVPCRVCAVESATPPESAEQDSHRSRREAASWRRAVRARASRLASSPVRSSGGFDVAA